MMLLIGAGALEKLMKELGSFVDSALAGASPKESVKIVAMHGKFILCPYQLFRLRGCNVLVTYLGSSTMMQGFIRVLYLAIPTY